jgi:protoporphyrinogen oxidase
MHSIQQSPADRGGGDQDKCVVLGAGPAGLAAAYALAKAGKNPVILERSANAGGLMRTIKRGSCEVDFGRKEIYDRIPEVVDLWEELLGEDFVPYPHRVGLLYNGVIVERSREFRGALRGMPPGMLLGAAGDYLRAKIGGVFSASPQNYEQRWHRAWGERLTRILSQGFSEKFYGIDWRDRPADFDLRKLDAESTKPGLWKRLLAAVDRSRDDSETPYQWRHPKRGTGQFIDALVEGIIANGGSFVYGAEVKSIERGSDHVEGVTYVTEAGVESLPLDHIVCAIPLAATASLLDLTSETLRSEDRDRGRQTILLYLFLDKPAEFPHAWLNVSCPDLVTGRVTNYANFGGDMVPADKGCIALEVFTRPEDPVLELGDEELIQLLIDEVGGANLIDKKAITDKMLIRLPGAEASNEFQNFRTPAMMELRGQILEIENLYECNRAGADISLHAGLKAADAIVASRRDAFVVEAAPEVVPCSGA